MSGLSERSLDLAGDNFVYFFLSLPAVLLADTNFRIALALATFLAAVAAIGGWK